MDLAHVAHGWGGVVPCNAIVTSARCGTTSRRYNADMDPVGTNGDAKNPYQVPIREEIAGSPPHLPGHQPPRGCHEKPKAAPPPAPVAAPVAAPAPPKEVAAAQPASAPPPASVPEETKATEEAVAQPARAAGADRLRRFWLGINVDLDFMELPSGTGLCKLDPVTALPLNDKHIFCTDSSGADFPQPTPTGKIVNNELVDAPNSGTSDGGIVPANVRIFLSLDYALNNNFLVGVRGGYVLNRYPGAAAISHGYAFSTGLYAEGRATAVIGKDALRKTGFAPIAFVGVGVSAFDGHTSGTATLCPATTPANNTSCFPAGAPATPRTTVNVSFWWSNGPAFVDGGFGIRYAPMPQFGFTAAARGNLSFGSNGLIPTLGPEIGAQFGF